MLKKKVIFSTLFICMLFAFTMTPLFSWESNITIAGDNGKQYEKPEVAYAPDYTVYVVYRQQNGGVSDIYMTHYDGVELTSENVSDGATFFSKHKCYEPEIEITPDGTIHVMWAMHDKSETSTHYIKYRRKVGDTWSQIYEIGSLHIHEEDYVFDLRLGVSTNVAADNETGAAPSYNVHTIFHLDEEDIAFACSMYGETIIFHGKIGEPDGSNTREKHADIAVDDNYVHYIWQRKVGFPYWEMHQKAENKLGGAWSEITPLTSQEEPWSSQRARIALDSDGYFHFTEFNKNINGNKKMKYRVEQPDGSLSEYVNLSNSGKIELYHYAELVIRDNTKNLDENGTPGDLSVFASMQMGQSKENVGGKVIFYSWKQNGVWSLYNAIPDTLQCLHQSADLSPDGDQAAVAWLKLTKAIILSVSSPIVEIPVGPPPPPPTV
ncbi:MAG: hypothetical protein GY757_31540, partial [bacterium]|nr:hypothetical protein [bacterium]